MRGGFLSPCRGRGALLLVENERDPEPGGEDRDDSGNQARDQAQAQAVHRDDSVAKLQIFQQGLPARPGIVARFLVRVVIRVRALRRFAVAHEAVSRTLIDHRLVFLARCFQCFFGFGDAGIYSLIVLAVEAVERTGNLPELRRIFRQRAVK